MVQGHEGPTFDHPYITGASTRKVNDLIRALGCLLVWRIRMYPAVGCRRHRVSVDRPLSPTGPS